MKTKDIKTISVITYCGYYFDTIQIKNIEWSFDTHNYIIGVC